MTCICDHAGYCPLLRTTMYTEQWERCRDDAEFHAAEKMRRGIRWSPPVNRLFAPKPALAAIPANGQAQPCIPCGSNGKPAKAVKPAGVGLQAVDLAETGPVVKNRQGRPALGLRDQFHGQSVFLIGGGPSFASVDQKALQQRGIMLAAMNNVATIVRPHIWFSVDLPRNFHETIWRDPAVMKFTFDKHLKSSRPVDSWSGTEFVKSGIRSEETPNTWGFAHCHGWDAKRFLDHPVPTWGCNSSTEDPDGESRHESVMLPAIWMLYWLGFRVIYLLGADFRMDDERQYAFDEKGQVQSNNTLFRWLDRRFSEARDHFSERGLMILNATEGSHLKAFERVTLDAAINATLDSWPKEVVTRGHYRPV